jgi:hypothetical protein
MFRIGADICYIYNYIIRISGVGSMLEDLADKLRIFREFGGEAPGKDEWTTN